MNSFLRLLTALAMGAAGQPLALAQPLSSLLIEDVTLIDGTGRPPRPGVWVLIQEGRIAQIRRGPISAPPQAGRVDGRDRFLIPGLMDMHVHLRGGFSRGGPDRQAGLKRLHSYLYSGVTSIYDAGNLPDFIFALRDEERSGKIDSPRIFASGGIVTYPGSHGASPAATLVDSWPQAVPKLDAHLARNPDLVKLTYEERGWGIRPLIPILPLDLMEEIFRYCNLHGVRTTVHASSELRARQAIFAGVDTLAHPVIQGPVSDGFVKLMAAKKIPMVSTLTIGERYSRLAEHPEYLDQPLYRDTLEESERRRLQTEESARQKESRWAAWMKIMTPVAQENLRRIDEAGGIVVAGTDQSLGPGLHRELELLVAGGIPPLQAIRIATLHGAVFLGKEGELGSVEEGKLADLVLLSADPSVDIDNAKRIVSVIKGGKIVDRAGLELPVNGK
ncbi:MAG: amidohydrolase family protein [Acidobacteriota bacterium]